MIKCPDKVLLLTYLDGELGENQTRHLEKHLEECRYCTRRLQGLAETQQICHEQIDLLQEYYQGIEIKGQQEVWQHIEKTIPVRRGVKTMKLRKAGVAAAIIAALTLVFSIPSVQVMANNFLQVFRVQQVETLTLTAQDIHSIQASLTNGNDSLDIEQFGKVEAVGEREVTKVSEAELADLDFDPLLPAEAAVEMEREDVPDVRMTLDVDGVNDFMKSLGGQDMLPEELDNQTFAMVIPEQLVIYYDHGSIMQGPSPELQVPAGVDVNQVASVMIDLPIWPESVRMQLKAVNDWTNTLLIPDTDGQARKISINGQQGVLVSEHDTCWLIWKQGDLLLIAQDYEGDADRLISTCESLR